MYHYAGSNPVRYTDPDGRVLYVCGTKEYMAAVQRELSNMCPGTRVNFDTGEVILPTDSKIKDTKGYEILSLFINSPKTNIIWLGDSRMKDAYENINGNSTQPYNTKVTLKNEKYVCDYNMVNGDYGPMNTVINFDPENMTGGQDDNYSIIRPPYIGLAHELGHSEGINNGTEIYDGYDYQPGTTPRGEINSLKRENEVRIENHLTPRSYYWQPEKAE